MTIRTCDACGEEGLLSLEEVKRVYGSKFDGLEQAENNPHVRLMCEKCGATE